MNRDAGRIPRGEPLAYFLTWTTYGTWLPGDERGWVAKPGEMRITGPRIGQHAMSRLTEPPLVLDAFNERSSSRRSPITAGFGDGACTPWHVERTTYTSS